MELYGVVHTGRLEGIFKEEIISRGFFLKDYFMEECK